MKTYTLKNDKVEVVEELQPVIVKKMVLGEELDLPIAQKQVELDNLTINYQKNIARVQKQLSDLKTDQEECFKLIPRPDPVPFPGASPVDPQ